MARDFWYWFIMGAGIATGWQVVTLIARGLGALIVHMRTRS